MDNERARALRKDMSDAEWKLWQELRRGQIEGYRFRRQHRPVHRRLRVPPATPTAARQG